MSAGLFTLMCPRCGEEMSLVEAGRSTCPRCHQAYLTRFGHLIPVPLDDADRQRVAPGNGGQP